MNIEVLISTMDLIDNNQLLKKMNIKTNSVTINQVSKETNLESSQNSKNRVYNYCQKGLSKSRNKAIENAREDICIIADDDLIYEKDYEEKIKDAYKKYDTADIICFWVPSKNSKRQTTKQKTRKISYLTSMRVSSYQITFKLNSIKKYNIKFDENFGAGSGKYIMGEENIFLFDCLRKNLNIMYVDEKIAEVKQEESTWFKGYNENYFISKGACYHRMSKIFSDALIYQFAIRKRKLYKEDCNVFKAIKIMKQGKREYIRNSKGEKRK